MRVEKQRRDDDRGAERRKLNPVRKTSLIQRVDAVPKAVRTEPCPGRTFVIRARVIKRRVI